MHATLAPSAKRVTTRSQRERLYELVESGYFGEARVELIGGEPVTAFPEGAAHDRTVSLVYEALRRTEENGRVVHLHSYLELPSGDAARPDVCVVGSSGETAGEDPLLVVEVAISTLRRDRTAKSELYAASNVPEYWIVNPRAGQIEVRRDPSGSEYVSLTLFEGEAAISALFAPEQRFRVADLLP